VAQPRPAVRRPVRPAGPEGVRGGGPRSFAAAGRGGRCELRTRFTMPRLRSRARTRRSRNRAPNLAPVLDAPAPQGRARRRPFANPSSPGTAPATIAGISTDSPPTAGIGTTEDYELFPTAVRGARWQRSAPGAGNRRRSRSAVAPRALAAYNHQVVETTQRTRPAYAASWSRWRLITAAPWWWSPAVNGRNRAQPYAGGRFSARDRETLDSATTNHDGQVRFRLYLRRA